MAEHSYAFVTLLTSDSYLPGALALAAALKQVHTSPHLSPEVPFHTVCLVTPESVDVSTIKLLRRAFNVVIGVELITDDVGQENLRLLGRPDLNAVLTKLHVFRLTQYSKIIFLDADVLPIRPLSHLFTLPHEFSAVPDVGWPDIFNSGVLVLTPGDDKFNALNTLLKSKGSWDGGDQGILNEWRGNDWNRLSFTYNTTPTAAYTYAPAYERFGSQISAIHFIGPNKPWNSLSFRPPGASTSQTQGDQPRQVYDYNSLVDMWYAAYDRHYRSKPADPTPEFEVRRYSSAWDEHGAPGLDVPAAMPEGAPLGLEELRRIAVEGMSTLSVSGVAMDERAPAEGQYQSLPLEGRIDLMRPRQEDPRKLPPAELVPTALVPPAGLVPTALVPTELVPTALTPAELVPAAPERWEGRGEEMTLEEPHTPAIPTIRRTWKLDLPPGSPPRMHTLPTPAPHEIPSTPYMQARSLPPSMPPTPSPHPTIHYRPQSMTTEPVTGRELLSSPPDSRPHEESLYPQPEGQQEQPRDHPPPKDQQQRQPQQQAQPPHHHRPEERPRPSSPPLVTWNPAIEPPPKDAPPASAFPADTYFPNIWDQRPSGHPDDIDRWGSPPPDSAAFFQEPTPSEIPESLVRQGHYREVMGEQVSGATPSPDRTKVKPVFPWEDKPRHLPGRLFPSSESPLPGAFLVPGPGTPEPHASHGSPTPSPLVGLPSTLNYANVWDTVPSIQRYASRLVRPSPPPQLLAPAFEVGRRRRGDTFRSWNERSEVSSRDGDDEDNADESEATEEDGVARSPWRADDSGSDRGSSRRRSSSLRTLGRSRKEYVSVGVQTDTREMKCQAVQVDLISPSVHPPRDFHPNGNLPVSQPRPGVPFKPTVALDTSTEPEPMTATPPLSPPSRKPVMQLPQSGTTSRIRPPYEPMPPPSPTRLPSMHTASLAPKFATQTMTPPRSMLHTVPPSSVRTLDSPSLPSPPSSVGPLSPPEGLPVPLPPRKGSRVWDPARGVDLLRRGSEEVLARFLRMGSTWEEDVTGVHGTHQ